MQVSVLPRTRRMNLRDLVANILDEVEEFELQSRYYDHFRTNIQGKVWISLSSLLWVKPRNQTLKLNNW